MKCVCGYEAEKETREEKPNEEIKKKFKRLYNDSYLRVFDYRVYDWRRKQIKIYICPECGTLKVDIKYL